MKKKFFDKNLMAEGLSQLKLPGFIFLIISVLGSVLPAIFSWISYQNYCSEDGIASTIAASAKIISISHVSMILLPVIYLAPFIFCLVLFLFLNSRKGSDYYHSLSTTRVSLFFSFSVSILIWLAIIILSSVLSASFVYAVSGMVFNAAFIPYLILTFFAGAALVTACMLLAMSITGTVLTNIVLFGLILFLPRFVTTIATYSIGNLFPILSSNSGGLANVSYNIPAKFACGYILNFNSTNKDQLYTSVSAVVYTLIIAVIYLAAACLLFHLRKSETAGSGAPNRVLQHVYRCIVTLPVALLIPLILTSYTAYSSGQSNFSAYWKSIAPVVITLAIISVFIYFLYELLTTKSPKKMLKSAPMLLAVAAVCVIFGLSINSVKNNILGFTPSQSEIESVSFLPTGSNNSSSTGGYIYNDYVVQNLTFNDDSIKAAVSQTLNDDVKTLKSENSSLYSQEYTNYHVGIHLKNGKYVERILFADKGQTTNIKDWMTTNSEYSENITLLPPEDSINQICPDGLSDQSSADKLWKSYKSEYAALSVSEKLSVIEYSHARQQCKATDNCLATIEVHGSNNLDSYVSYYPVTVKTPKTAAMYVELYNAKDKAKAESLIASFTDNSKAYSYCYITLFNDSDITEQSNVKYNNNVTIANFSSTSSDISSTDVSKCFNILLRQMDDPVDLTEPYVCVTVGGEKKSYSYYQAISGENAKLINSLDLSDQN